MNPSLKRAGAAVQDILLVRARQIGVEGDVEAKIDDCSRDLSVRAHGSAARERTLADADGKGH